MTGDMGNKIHIIPTIFATNKQEFSRRFRHLVPHFKEFQIDIMDGTFVPKSSLRAEELPNLQRYKGKSFEAHLMVNYPERFIPLLKQKGFRRAIAHIESFSSRKNVQAFIDETHTAHMECGLAINPQTSMDSLYPYLRKIQLVLFLGVHPGKEGQSFIRSVLQKIQRFKKFNKNIPVQVDGGINPAIALMLAKLGVNRFNTGSYTALADNPKSAAGELIKKIKPELRIAP